MSNTQIPYLSNELVLFEKAVRWKSYFSSFFKPYLKDNVLEVGAGIGGNILFLFSPQIKQYDCIEPDSKQASIIADKISSGKLPSNCKVENRILDKGDEQKYNAILYIDVIEHIEKDAQELQNAYNALVPGGMLCVLVPANPKDYSPFDKAIGHYRRYSRKMLLSTLPAGMEVVSCKYLDTLGAISSKVNKFFLKQASPTLNQILFWDRFLVPVSKMIDPLTGYSIGKSLILVAKKK
jgi:SAM-dependent methyltransferase